MSSSSFYCFLQVTLFCKQAGALQLTESLPNGTQDLAKLYLSLCGLTSQCIVKLNTEFAVVGCLNELNLGGNCIKQEVGFLLFIFP